MGDLGGGCFLMSEEPLQAYGLLSGPSPVLAIPTRDFPQAGPQLVRVIDPGSTKGPMWGYPRPVLGAVDPFLEPFRGRLSPNIDYVSEKLTLRYPREGPWVVVGRKVFIGDDLW